MQRLEYVTEFGDIADSSQAEKRLKVVLVRANAGHGKTFLLAACRDSFTGLSLTLDVDALDADIPGYAADKLAELLGVAWTDAGSEPAMARDLATALSSRGPQVLLIDDAHWIDELSSRILWRTLRQLVDYPVTVVVAFRPCDNFLVQRLTRQLSDHTLGAIIDLQPFTREDIRQLLDRRFRLDASDRVVSRILELTDGIPLHVGLIAERMVRGDGTLLGDVTSAGGGLLEGIADWWEDTSAATRRAVEVVCVAEVGLHSHELQQVLDLWGQTVPAMRELRANCPALSITSGGVIRPRNALVAAALRETLPSDYTRDIHRVLGEVLSGEEALYHRIRAADDNIAPLAQELRAAGEAELAAGRYRQAVGLARRLLDTVRDVDSLRLTYLAAVRGGMVSELTYLQPHLGRVPFPLLRGACQTLIAAALDDATAVAEHFGEIASLDHADEAITDRLLRGYAATEFVRVMSAYFRFDLIIPMTAGVLADLDSLADTGSDEVAREAAILAALIRKFVETSHTSPEHTLASMSTLQEIVDGLATFPDTRDAQLSLLSARGSIACNVGLFEEGRKDLEAAALAPKGHVNWQMQSRIALSHIYFENGQWDDVVQLLRSGLGDALDILSDPAPLAAYATLGAVHSGRGDVTEAQAHRRIIDSVEDQQLAAYAAAESLWALVWTWQLTGDEDTIAPTVVAAYPGFQFNSLLWTFAGPAAVAGMVRALIAADRMDDAAALVASGLSALWVEPEVSAYVDAHSRALLDLAQGRADRAFQDLMALHGRFAAHAESVRAGRLIVAMVALDAARAWLAGSREPEVTGLRAALDAARLLALRVGALPLLGMIHDLDEALATEAPEASPVASPASPLFDFTQLTAREREISYLVGQGLSNQEMAEQLFLSVRTVEYHVYNATHKLNLSSRVELRRLVRDGLSLN
ncbi:LuxR family transcriptional regulator [Corynebacterium sp.]|uniref:helix-turn-helix transcriptional regulator n=1 Tax=Corynebacterium sp. TaxID=1720 RepID=UPI0026E1068D|nr:LuxR family transcriptional regulator [Corynebacterium sp.]MDO5511228.1 LuxR C-terminal-related transcriptional regulator [Corynebacterium sp.]